MPGSELLMSEIPVFEQVVAVVPQQSPVVVVVTVVKTAVADCPSLSSSNLPGNNNRKFTSPNNLT